MKTILSLVLVALAASAPAQVQVELRYSFLHYDLDATVKTTCAYLGDPRTGHTAPTAGTQRITSTGSTTVLRAETAGTGPFTLLGVNDVLVIRTGVGGGSERVIRQKDSNDQVVVESAIDISNGASFGWWDSTCAATTDANTDEGGWVSVAGASDVLGVFQLDNLNATSIDVTAQCRCAGLRCGPIEVFPGVTATTPLNLTAEGLSGRRAVFEPAPWAHQCRWTALITGDDDSTEADVEDINAYWVIRTGK